MKPRTALLAALAAVVVIFFVLAAVSSDLLVHWLWFDALGYASVYRTMLLSRWASFAVAGLLTFIWLYGNWAVAARSAGQFIELPWNEDLIDFRLSGRLFSAARLRWPAALVAGFAALTVGAAAYRGWELWLRAWYAVPYGRTDPLFDNDLSYYLLQLPALEALQAALMSLTVLAMAGAALLYLLKGAIRFEHNWISLSPTARTHLAALLSVGFVAKAWDYRLDALRLLYSEGGRVFGATYTDVHINLPVLRVALVIALMTAIAGLLAAWSGRLLGPAIGVGLLMLTMVVGRGIVPSVVQRYYVQPNELALEAPYIGHHIELTREAYDLTSVERRPFDPAELVTLESAAAGAETLANARLWDAGPLHTAYQQLQGIRNYYEFSTVDVDRYSLDGGATDSAGAGQGATAVMLSARELNTSRLAPQAQTWENLWLVYTHGYGVTMTPVSRVESNGGPTLFLRDIPPVSDGGPAVERPEIYFGELTSNPVIVRNNRPEFDYPQGDSIAETIYEGTAGVAVGSTLKQLLFSWYYGEWSILLSDYLTDDSRVLLHRQIQDRISTLAPFLRLDRDPYLTVIDGRLLWIQDAYTSSERFPYSLPVAAEPTPSGAPGPAVAAAGRGASFNYLRNSVKATIDAYDGTVRLYAFDPEDPLLRTYREIFPELFQAASGLPGQVRSHLRYPEDFFRIQVRIYSTYHMDDPRVFYNREDVWTTPREMYAGTAIPMAPYYILTELPATTAAHVGGGTIPENEPPGAEFVLMQPLTPANRDNLIAWIAGRSDEPHYGEIVVYEFPKDRTIFGPMQIEARIDQDPVISQQLSLWDQRGSQVIRGNLLVIPVAQGVLDLEPVFLRAEQNDLPELRRVIIANGPTVTMQPTLASALAEALPDVAPELAAIFGPPGEAPAPRETAAQQAGEEAPPGQLSEELAARALVIYRRAQERLRAGDWAGYGEAMEELRGVLERLASGR